MGQPRARLSFIFGLFKQTSLQFLQQIYVKKCPSSIWCRDWNPRLSEHESPPITTRPEGKVFIITFRMWRSWGYYGSRVCETKEFRFQAPKSCLNICLKDEINYKVNKKLLKTTLLNTKNRNPLIHNLTFLHWAWLYFETTLKRIAEKWGQCPCLVVMGGGLVWSGHEFESRYQMVKFTNLSCKKVPF